MNHSLSIAPQLHLASAQELVSEGMTISVSAGLLCFHQAHVQAAMINLYRLPFVSGKIAIIEGTLVCSARPDRPETQHLDGQS